MIVQQERLSQALTKIRGAYVALTSLNTRFRHPHQLPHAKNSARDLQLLNQGRVAVR